MAVLKWLLSAVGALAWLPVHAGWAGEPAAWPSEQMIVIPIRLHVLKSDEYKDVDCGLTDNDLIRILGKVNAIWDRAGIYWALETIVREPIRRSERFRDARSMEEGPDLGSYRWILPEESREFDGLHVYYLHDLSVNGVWLGSDYALVKETAKLREVEGGIDEPIPRVTAHELGHILGLAHRQDRTNLLASGTTGTSLNDDEVNTARTITEEIPGSLTYPALVEALKGDARADSSRSAMLRRWLKAIDDRPVKVKPSRTPGERNPPPR